MKYKSSALHRATGHRAPEVHLAISAISTPTMMLQADFSSRSTQRQG